MARGYARTQGPNGVTHRSRGRWTIVSPQNMKLPSTKGLVNGTPWKCPVCGSNKKTKKGSYNCKACAKRAQRQIKKEAAQRRESRIWRPTSGEAVERKEGSIRARADAAFTGPDAGLTAHDGNATRSIQGRKALVATIAAKPDSRRPTPNEPSR